MEEQITFSQIIGMIEEEEQKVKDLQQKLQSELKLKDSQVFDTAHPKVNILPKAKNNLYISLELEKKKPKSKNPFATWSLKRSGQPTNSIVEEFKLDSQYGNWIFKNEETTIEIENPELVKDSLLSILESDYLNDPSSGINSYYNGISSWEKERPIIIKGNEYAKMVVFPGKQISMQQREIEINYSLHSHRLCVSDDQRRRLPEKWNVNQDTLPNFLLNKLETEKRSQK